MNGYDMIVAVTQNNINAHFKFLYGAKDGIQPTIKIYDESNEEGIDATIEPPRIHLNVKREPTKAIFQLTLRKGTLKYWQGRGKNAELNSLSILNWVLGFKVDLNLRDMDVKEIPKAIQEKIKPHTPKGEIDPSIFSVRQLFMNFQNAFLTELDSSATSFPPEVADPKTSHELANQDIEDALFNFLKKYIKSLKTNGHNILGYSIHTKNPNAIKKIDPTFPPTNVTYTTNPFQPDGKHNSDFSSYEPGLDTLNYLMMTGHRDWPSPNSVETRWFGNWVTSKDEYGVIAIAKHLFIDGFLLPKLIKTTTLKPYYEFINFEDGTYKPKICFEENFDSYKSDPHNFGVYNYHHEFSKTFDYYGPLWTEEHTWKTTTDSKVEIPAGGNVINISGNCVLRFDCVHWHGAKNAALWTPSWQESKVRWEFTIRLSGAPDGVLMVDITPKQEDFVQYIKHNITVERGGDWWYKLGEMFKDIFDILHELREKMGLYNDLIDAFNVLYDLPTQICEQINQTDKFIFLGGQSFQIYNPRFNNELDLIANIKYQFD
ncbi:MAG: hypothetical protein RID53_19065 [Coleofasciculus sp. B1-GNL1-01]|uniref:hypothetical protein n=1 Tax=Coleofasciculus sp. B1-GNL1-01 TaxID=3068484 RepID=UPI0032F16341